MADKTTIDILINAQNKASDQLAQVGKSLSAIEASSRKTAKASKRAGKDISEMASGFSKFAGGAKMVAGGIAAIAAGLTVFSKMKGLLNASAAAYVIQEKAVNDLAKTMEVMGDKTAEAMPDLTAFASELQALTNVGDEVTLGTMKRLRTLGFETEELKGATQAAIGLTAAFGSQEAAIEAVAKAHEGDFDALKERIPALREAKTLAEKTAIVNKAAAEGFVVASEGTKTMGGALTALNNSWGDTLESIGQLLAPFVTRIAERFNAIAPIIQEKIGLLLPIMEYVAERVQEISFYLFEQMIKGYTMVETVINNFGDSVNIVWLMIKLGVTKVVNDIIYFFTERLPQVGAWFADNWINLFTDLFNIIVISNMNAVKQMIENFNIFFRFLKSGMAGGIGGLMEDIGKNMGRNLLEGFEATTKPLPEAIARTLTDGEREMSDQVAHLAGGIANEYNENVEKRLGFFDELFKAEAGAGAKAFKGIGTTEGAKKRDRERLEKEAGKGGTDLTATDARFLTRGSSQTTPAEQMVEQQKQAKEALIAVKEGVMASVDFLSQILAKEAGGDIEIVQSLK